MIREELRGIHALRDREDSELIAGIVAIQDEKPRVSAGVLAAKDILSGLAKDVPHIYGDQGGGAVLYRAVKKGISEYSSVWFPNGETIVSSADRHEIVDPDVENRRIVESAAPITAAILLKLVDSVRRYDSLEKVSMAVSAFKKLERAHTLANRVNLAVSLTKGEDQIQTGVEERAWGFQNQQRMDHVEAALVWYRERETVTSGVAAVIENSMAVPHYDAVVVRETFAKIAQDLDSDGIFPYEATTKSGWGRVVVGQGSTEECNLEVLSNGVVLERNKKTGKSRRFADNELSELLLLRGREIANALVVACVANVLPNLPQPEPVSA